MNYRTLGAQPISEENPQGEDVRYEDLFLSLESEIEKLSSPTDRDAFSWETVARLSSTVLKDHSKDLLAASYLSAALFHLRKGEGLDESTLILNDLFTHYWESLYPAKRRTAARISALNWWLEKTLAGLNGNGDLSLTPDRAAAVLDRLKGMESFIGEHLAGEPSLDPLVRAITARVNTEKAPPAEEKPKVAPVPVTPDSTQVPDITGESPDEAVKALRPVMRSIKQTARLFREERINNPQAYRWLRFSLWESVKTPPLSADRVTRIDGPNGQMLSHLAHLQTTGEHEALVHAAEAALANPRNMFLIDLNRYTWLGLSSLGDGCRVAQDAVYFETRMFVSRLSGLDDLVFSDGTPFANEETKEWLNQGFKDNNVQAHSIMGTKGILGEDHKDETDTIREHYRLNGSLADTAALFEEKIRINPTKRGAALFRLDFARFLAQEKKEMLAAAHLEQLLDDVDRHGLASWEPALALDILRVMYRVYRKLPGRQKDQAGEILARIARIDTRQALNLKGS